MICFFYGRIRKKIFTQYFLLSVAMQNSANGMANTADPRSNFNLDQNCLLRYFCVNIGYTCI